MSEEDSNQEESEELASSSKENKTETRNKRFLEKSKSPEKTSSEEDSIQDEIDAIKNDEIGKHSEKKWKTLIVDLITGDGLSVCIVSERWVKPKYVFYQNYSGFKTANAVKKHKVPNDSYTTFKYQTRKICGVYLIFVLRICMNDANFIN